MPAPERVPEVGLIPAPPGTAEPRPAAPADTDVLLHGALTVRGQVREASNAVLYCEAVHDGRSVTCVYKPVAGERPLWDFPDGTLAQREVAAYLVSEATGWGLIPPTVLRDGPYGEGMVQLWIDADGEAGRGIDDGTDDGTDDSIDDEVPGEGDGGDTTVGATGTTGGTTGIDADAEPASGDEEDGGASPDGRTGALLALSEDLEPAPGWKAVVEAETGDGRTVLLVHADDIRLRRLAVLDAVINNADRKGGHLLPAPDGRLYGIDHGVTFHTEDKLRTLLWGWAGEPLPAEAGPVLERLAAELQGALGERLAALLTAAETDALRERVRRLRETGVHPAPGGQWPSIPWPPV